MPRPMSSLLASFLLMTCCGLNVFAAAEDRPPNFIVIFCDNLGYGDIEPFGSTLHRTPHLNRMAREGRKFTHFCVTAGVCTPSRASLMTGCYPQRVGMHTNPRDGWVLRPVSRYGLNPDEQTIAETLKQSGYATAIVGKWHLGDQPPFLPTRQGFDWFFGVPYSDDMTARVWKTDGSQWPPLPLMENEDVVEAPCDRNGLTKRYTERAMEWIEAHKDEPFFLYFPQAMPGSTSTPFSSDAFRGKSRNGPWGDAIEELDWSMGQMLDQLVELGIAEDTLVIWTSDNGAPINRDLADLSRGSNRPLHGRGYTTSEGAFRVPTIVWQPGTVPADTTCDELASTMDLLPTFAKLGGAKPPVEGRIDGRDITPLLHGRKGAKSPHEAYYYYMQDELQAVRSGPWKLFLPVQPSARHPHLKPGTQSRPLLFNVVDDIGSKHDVADEHPAIVKQLLAMAEIARQDLGDSGRKGTGQRARGEIPQENVKPQVLPEENALELIEGVRGGRHWADARTAPPKSPAESAECFEIEPGFEISLFAAEPLVKDPVAITFDREGRMFVVEYGDYPIGPAEGGQPLSRIVMLEDTDDDGTADKRHVFADSLDFAHSLMAYQDGLLVGAKTKILYLEDTDGDHVADVRKTLFDGFTPAHPQMQIGNPRWGLDNWVYLNYGPGKITTADSANGPVTMPRKDFRFHPETLEFRADSGLGQFGNTIDRWGNRFYCTNRNPIMTSLVTPEVLQRNPFAISATAHYDVGKSGGDTRVYPLIEMKSNYLSHAGTHTSACGVTAYTGDLTGNGLEDSVFVCEPIGHLVTRSIVASGGLRLKAERARPKADFLASSDTWFRPASLANGPDGDLYLADMYRLWVEHPKFLPAEIAEKLDWRAGEDRGRIYRITKTATKRRDYVPPQSATQMVAMLEGTIGWRQFTGQRLLVEGRHKEAARSLRKLLHESEHPTTRLHALWTLDGLGVLDAPDVVAALGDENAVVRRDACRLSVTRLSDAKVQSALKRLITDSDPRVRFELAIALGEDSSESSTDVLSELAVRDGADEWFSRGLLSSLKSRSGQALQRLVSSKAFTEKASPQKAALVTKLSAVVGARGDINELESTLDQLDREEQLPDWCRAALITGLGQGLPRYRGDLGRLSLSTLMASPPEALKSSVAPLTLILDQAQAAALDASRQTADRVAAVALLSFQPFDRAAPALEKLITSGQPVEIQLAGINALSRARSAEAAEIVLNHWSELGPSVRSPALGLLLSRTDSTGKALTAMEDGRMLASALSIDQRVRLLKHSNPDLRKQAEKLFGGAVSSNRQAVAREYQSALKLDATVARGRAVYRKICFKCHRIDGEGHEAGPDLSDVRNRSKLALLYDILDPNSKVEPRFSAYTVVTVDGKVASGLIVSETDEAIVLRMAEGKQQTIGRAEIDEIRASNVSLMPEGVEKDVTPQEMADLLEFLKNRTPSP